MNKDDLFNPPAIVQYQESFSAIMKRAGEKNAKVKKYEKMSVSAALEIGQMLLRARPLCAVGEWPAALDEQGISRQRASDFMRGAEQPPEEQAKWESIADLRRAREAQSIPRESHTSQEGRTGQEPSTNSAPQQLHCRACRVSGNPKPGCKDCEAMNKGAEQPGQGAEAAARPPTPIRGRGHRRPSPPKEKSPNQNVEDIAKVIRRVMNRIARAYGIEYHDAVLNITPRTYDNPLLQRVNEKWFEFKKLLEEAERTLAMLKRKK
jgi:hypothetical protein